jgi:hypothetical protein
MQGRLAALFHGNYRTHSPNKVAQLMVPGQAIMISDPLHAFNIFRARDVALFTCFNEGKNFAQRDSNRSPIRHAARLLQTDRVAISAGFRSE